MIPAGSKYKKGKHMSTTRMNKLFYHLNESADTMVLGAGTAVLGAAVLSRMGYQGQDAIGAAGMMAAGTLITGSAAKLIIPDDYTASFTYFNQLKNDGVVKFTAQYVAGQATNMLVGGALLLLSGSVLKDVAKNSAAISAGILLTAFPMACYIVGFAEKLVADFNAQHNGQSQQSPSLKMQ